MNIRTLWTLLLPLLLLSCSTGAFDTSGRDRPEVRIDHVVVGTSNLEAGIRELETLTGVRAAIGGTHPGQGTRNALISLGDDAYLELYAPNPAEDVDSATVTELEGLARLTPLYWAVSTRDAAALRSYFDSVGIAVTVPEPGSRVRPDGSVLEWLTLGFEQIDHPLAPFFIQWKQLGPHPSRTSPGGCRLVSLRLRDPAPDVLRKAVRPLGLDVPIERASARQMEVQLSCPRGDITL